MKKLEITKEDILKKLNKLKVDKSPGLDNMHPKFLKMISPELVEPIHKIFKQSVGTSVVPTTWKEAKMCAI